MARNRMKRQAGQHHTEREFEEGDWVFVRLQPYKQSSLNNNGKISYHLNIMGRIK